MFSRRKVPKIIALLLTVSITLSSVIVSVFIGANIHAFGVVSEGADELEYTYTVKNNEVIITGNNNPIGDLVIPSTINGLVVTQIADLAFNGCSSITSVEIPETVSTIGSQAFFRCFNLNKIKINNLPCYIGTDAFSYTGYYSDESNWQNGLLYISGALINTRSELNTVFINSETQCIAQNALNCSSLESIIVDENNAYFCNDETGVLYNKEKTNLIKYPANCPEKNYTIPENVDTIGENAFCNCKYLEEVFIPESVKKIGPGAFNSCGKISTINIPKSISAIEPFSFMFCSSLKKIEIPNGVKSIGAYAFDSCSSLKNITIPESVTEIGFYAFSECLQITNIFVDENNKVYSNDENGVLINKEKSELIQYPPANTSQDYTIPDNIETIKSYAFDCCNNLKKISISSSVNNIEQGAFARCDNLNEIKVDDENPYYSNDDNMVLFNKEKTILIQYPKGNTSQSYNIPEDVEKINAAAFINCINLSEISVPISINEIEAYAFFGCSSISEIKIPEGVTNIEQAMFSGCTNLKKIELPDSIITIDNYAFQYCNNLLSIVIPVNVNSISQNAFYGCLQLNKISVDDGNDYYSSDEKGVLFNKSKTELIQYPVGNKSKEYIIPESVTAISSYAFSSNSSLISITIPDSVNIIGSSAFYNCSNLSSVNIPKSLTMISNSTFNKCSNLKNITIPNSVRIIGQYAFANCNGLEDIYIPESVEKIEKSVFMGCNNIVRINVDEKNKYYSSDDIGVLFDKEKTVLIRYPAANSNQIYEIPKSVTTISDNAFSSCSNLISVDIPDFVSDIGLAAFQSCKNLTSVNIPNGLTRIEDNLFSSCEKLKVINIPENVRIIGEFAFSNCKSLENITIPEKVTSIGRYSFVFCISLNKISVEGNNQYYSSDERGVLFNKEKTKIIQYPAGNTAENYIIPNFVECIMDFAFSKSNNLKKISFSKAISNINYYAFRDCANLSDIYYPGTEEDWNKITINPGNDCILSSTKHFNSFGPDISDSERFEIPNDSNVVLSYEKGCFGENDGDVSAKITKLKDEEEKSGAIRLIAKGEKLVQAGLYSIKLYDNDQNELQPQSGKKVTVKLPIPESFKDFDDFTVVHWYGNNGEYEKLKVSRNEVLIENGYLIFETGRFSEFAICVDKILTDESTSLLYNESKQISNYPSANNIEYSSSDESVVTVDSSGKIKAVGVGSATITASIKGTEITESVNIKVSYAWWQWIIRILLLGFLWY